MGLLGRFNSFEESLRRTVRSTQERAEQAGGQAVRVVTGQDGTLPSVVGGREVFGTLVMVSPYGSGLFTYRSREETVDAVGWCLHNNRLGPMAGDDDIAHGGMRVIMLAGNAPLGSLVDLEAMRLVQGVPMQTWFWGQFQVHAFVVRTETAWKVTFHRRRLRLSVEIIASPLQPVDEHFCVQWAQKVFYALDMAAVDSWQAEHNALGDLTVLPGNALGAAAPKPAVLAPIFPQPQAFQVAEAPDDVANAHKMRDWDGWTTAGSVMGWEATARHVLGADFEGLIYAGPGRDSVQFVTADVPDLYRAPERFRTSFFISLKDMPPPFEGVALLAVGRDVEGYGTAIVVINELAFFARYVGGNGTQQDMDFIYRIACAALEALPG
jgi:hypothetical protein